VMIDAGSSELRNGKQTLRQQKTVEQSQVSSALVNLGFRSPEVDKVLEQLDFAASEMTVEEGIRQGLAALTNL